MVRSIISSRGERRSAMILMTVVVMLGLFAVVAIAFVLYAESEANASKITREAQQRSHTNAPAGFSGDTNDAAPIPTDIFNAALGQLIYDVRDDSTGIHSAMRGWGLARAAFGLHYTGTPQAPVYSPNDTPFNGIGVIRGTTNMPTTGPLAGQDRFNVVNYQYRAADGSLLDPERIGPRTGPTATTWSVGANNYFPINAPYTYPDSKDLYLAAVDPQTGRVLVPSFYRPWIFGSLASNNANWSNGPGKYLLSRPRPQDHVFNGSAEFPFPQVNPDGSYGDVEQLLGKNQRQLDSLWMDLDLPVRTWKGKNYKPLVAFLVMDLDGRINLNVAGNKKSAGNVPHSSHQGWGKWEMDLRDVLSAVTGPSTDVPNLLNARYGTDALPNRKYSLDGLTLGAGNDTVPSGTGTHFYGQADFDGSTATNPGGSTSILLPSNNAGNGTYRTMVRYGPNFQNGSVAERQNHPLLFNPYLLDEFGSLAGGRDRVFGQSEMFFLNYAFNGDDVNYRRSELGRLAPAHLGRSCTPGAGAPAWILGAVNPRFLTTTVSNDFDRVGMTPWLFNHTPNYQKPAPTTLPLGGAVAFPGQAQRTAAQPAIPLGNAHEFDPVTWQSLLSQIGAVDLNRKMADYRNDPTQAYEAPGNVTAASAARAQADRQLLARDIFDRLCAACGTRLTGTTPAANAATYNALRTLGQIAVNIVDYIDHDDYMTPFQWNAIRSSAAERETIFGNEQPRLVINEVNAEFDNDPADPGTRLIRIGPPPAPPIIIPPRGANRFDVKVWVELHNPLTPEALTDAASLSHGGGAPLVHNGTSVYRMKITDRNTRLREETNLLGEDDSTRGPNIPRHIRSLVDFTTAPPGQQVVPPSNRNNVQHVPGGMTSFCVVGPQAVPGAGGPQCTLTMNTMQFRVDRNFPGDMVADPTNPTRLRPKPPTVILQRLACPHLPFNATTNPYITVDYFEMLDPRQVNNASTDSTLAGGGNSGQQPMNERRSYGRKQPLSGVTFVPTAFPGGGVPPTENIDSNVVAMNINPAPVANQMHHTFFRHNSKSATANVQAAPNDTLDQQFEWMVHLDRALINQMELFHVSAFRPHELTHQFIIGRYVAPGANPALNRHRHTANWESDGSRLFRALELLQTRDRTYGLGIGGRTPGKVNINTIWNVRVFQAVCDANGPNLFAANQTATQTGVTQVWNALRTSRTPTGVPSANDRPFWGLGLPISPTVAQFPGGIGVENTILRHVVGTNPPIKIISDNRTLTTQPNPTIHPYIHNEMLRKISGNLTTRSNCFAVWMTVGYFEVRNQGPYTDINRPILGKEIDDGALTRHRFFSIVDRTQITRDPALATLQGPAPVFISYEPVLPTTSMTTPDPQTTAVNTTVQVRVPANFGNGNYLTGTYDGRPWTISVTNPRMQLTLAPDKATRAQALTGLSGTTVTPEEQQVTVEAVAYDPTRGGILTLRFTSGGIQAHRGGVLTLNTSLPGNPGPQPGFSYRDPRYAPVVPFGTQVK